MENLREEKNIIGSKIQAVPKDKIEIGIDLDSNLAKELVTGAQQTITDVSALDNFLNISQSREQVYQLIDTMSQDSTIAAIIETYVEDICEPNDRGEIVWVESTRPEVNAYITYLIDTLDINKHINNWATYLVKYGDLYLKLYHKSDYENDPLFGMADDVFNEEEEKRYLTEGVSSEDGEKLNEEILVSYYPKSDHYVHYVESEPNPAEMYELTKFGKTVGYIKAETDALVYDKDLIQSAYLYRTRRDDVIIYQPTEYVHACVDDNSSRIPEEVEIFLTDDDYKTNVNANKYRVKRGQSLLYNSFRVWRLLSLLENAVALNRINRSSILRILEVECGNMSPEGIQETLRSIKTMVEQKTAIKQGNNMQEYVNPGPVENTIYLATNGDIGRIQTQELGSAESDPKNLLDLDYYLNKLFGSLRVPKQYFAQTDDGAGFNGGESLAIISSRYGKSIKKYQNYLTQCLTDLFNLFLIDKGLDGYINQFVIKMQAPVTKEMIDRKEQSNNEIGMIRDLMDVIANYIEDDKIKLEALKTLLSSSSQDGDLINLVNEAINQINQEEKENEGEGEEVVETEEESGEESNESNPRLSTIDLDNLSSSETTTTPESEEAPEAEEELPSFQELGLEDAVDIENNQ